MTVEIYFFLQGGSLVRSSVVFLRRIDGSVNFTKSWDEYRTGFGDRAGEFWLGLSTLHTITNLHPYRLRVELTAWSGEERTDVYNQFAVGAEVDGFRLNVTGYNRSESTTLSDSMEHHDGMQFSTVNRDNDLWVVNDCARRDRGGWWYNRCSFSKPTGVYRPAGYTGYEWADGGIGWWGAYDDARPFKEVTLKLIPV